VVLVTVAGLPWPTCIHASVHVAISQVPCYYCSIGSPEPEAVPAFIAEQAFADSDTEPSPPPQPSILTDHQASKLFTVQQSQASLQVGTEIK